jgi:hypothetical protein
MTDPLASALQRTARLLEPHRPALVEAWVEALREASPEPLDDLRAFCEREAQALLERLVQGELDQLLADEARVAEDSARLGDSLLRSARAIRVLDRCCLPFLLRACADQDALAESLLALDELGDRRLETLLQAQEDEAARRLVEAGVSVVTMSASFFKGDWDDHGKQQAGALSIAEAYKGKLPLYDRCVHALITDLHERGMDKDVAVVIWGEFGRTPKINEIAGRHHWPMAGHVLFSGGGLTMGQVTGDTGPRGERERSRSTPYTPQNVLATLYHVLGIDPAATLPDHNGRPHYVLDDRDAVKELV